MTTARHLSGARPLLSISCCRMCRAGTGGGGIATGRSSGRGDRSRPNGRDCGSSRRRSLGGRNPNRCRAGASPRSRRVRWWPGRPRREWPARSTGLRRAHRRWPPWSIGGESFWRTPWILSICDKQGIRADAVVARRMRRSPATHRFARPHSVATGRMAMVRTRFQEDSSFGMTRPLGGGVGPPGWSGNPLVLDCYR